MATYTTRGGDWIWQPQHASTTLSNHLYGAERLGILQVIDVIVSEDPAASVTAVNTLLDANGYTTHDDGPRPFQVFHTFRGEKQYEITNHLGNVMVVVKEQPLTLVNNGVFQLADVVSATDYYPFGLEMPGRVYEAGRYGFGFNGKIEDDEILSDGRWQDYGFRAYRSDIGRFVSVDPLKKEYPDFSPYASFGNSPLVFIDNDGRKIVIYYLDDKGKKRSLVYTPGVKPKTDNEFVQDFHRAVSENMQYDESQTMQGLANEKGTISIRQEGGLSNRTEPHCFAKGDERFCKPVIYWNPNYAMITTKGGAISPSTILLHEAIHGLRMLKIVDVKTLEKFTDDLDDKIVHYDDMEEQRTILIERTYIENKNAQLLLNTPVCADSEQEGFRTDHAAKGFYQVSDVNTIVPATGKDIQGKPVEVSGLPKPCSSVSPQDNLPKPAPKPVQKTPKTQP
jgi:RHS repeat-associated protein